MGIALPAHREKESMMPDLRNSLYQSTQPLLAQRSLPHQSIKPYLLLPRPRSQVRKAMIARRYLNANKNREEMEQLKRL
jgi:hypothetical protein